MSNPLAGIPLIGNLFDNTDDQAMAQLAKNSQLYNGIKLPELVWKDYAPELYTNETANYETINEDPLLRSAQMSYLSKMAGLADKGLSEADDAGFLRARQQGQQMAKSGVEAALQNAQARGVGGSGLEFAMREMANQGGAQRAQEAGLNQAAEAARMRAMYQQAYGNAMGQVRGQDMQAKQANANIINQFNMANTQNRNATNMANVGLKNQAQLTNNQGRNDVKQQNFNNQLQRAGGQAQANTGMAQGYAAQNAANQADRNMWLQAGMMGLGYGSK